MDIKKLRTKHEITQMELAKKSGVGRFNISLAESGLRELKKSEKAKIKEAFQKLGV